VRVKRQQQTFCFLCNPETETIGTIKQRIFTILTQQHPMKNVDVHIQSVTDLRIVSSVTSKSDPNQPPLVLLDTDTLEYIQQKQTEQVKISRNNTGSEDTNQTVTNKVNDTNSDHGLVLYLLLPIVSGNDDVNTVEEWETIQVVSTDI
jgi:hypothetical protein